MFGLFSEWIINKTKKVFYYKKKETFCSVFIRCIIAFLNSFGEIYRKYLFFRIRRKNKNESYPIVKLFDGSVIRINASDDGISLDLFYSGIRERSSTSYLLSKINKEDVFYDIGANIGYYTIITARRLRDVIAFEPYSKTYELLKKNVALNVLKNVKKYNLGIGQGVGNKILYVPSKKNLAFFSEEVSRNEKHIIKEEVPIVSLDHFLENFSPPPPTWIKMDVEGYEYSVIKGAKDVLGKYKPKIFMELHTNRVEKEHLKELVKILLDLGYKIDYYVIETQKSIILPFLDKTIEKLYACLYQRILKKESITLEYLYDNDVSLGAIEMFLS